MFAACDAAAAAKKEEISLDVYKVCFIYYK